MRALAFLLWLALAGGAQAQPFQMPPPAGVEIQACAYNVSPPAPVNGQGYMIQCDSSGHATIIIVPPILTPSAPSGSMTLTTGGTAQNIFATNEIVHGCLISNPLSATDQGISVAENIYVSFITTAVSGGAVATTPLYPGQSLPCPGGLTTAISWIAATTGHKINAWKD